MKVSANEVMMLATKAARGGGAPPAQAAAFGRAALRHLVEGRDPGALDKALDAMPEGPILTLPLVFARGIERVVAGAETTALSLTAAPELMMSYAQSLPFATDVTLLADGLLMTLDLDRPAPQHPVARLALPQALADKMQALAAKTFVPETAASRASGAGAGLTDND